MGLHCFKKGGGLVHETPTMWCLERVMYAVLPLQAERLFPNSNL